MDNPCGQTGCNVPEGECSGECLPPLRVKWVEIEAGTLERLQADAARYHQLRVLAIDPGTDFYIHCAADTHEEFDKLIDAQTKGA